jgi:hypothetical protein
MAEQTDSEAAPTAERRRLGNRLLVHRETAKMSRGAAGKVIRGSESKISRMEAGRVGFRERDVDELLQAYGVDGRERAELLAMVESANRPNWWASYTDMMPSWLQYLVGLEDAAQQIRLYQPRVVPELLQTEAYATAVLRGGPEKAPKRNIDQLLRLQMRRQRVLLGPHLSRVWVWLDEGVLRRTVGGRDVMRGQVEYLLDLCRRGRLTLQVVPFSFGAYAAEHSFCLFRFAGELPDVVHVKQHAGAQYVDKGSQVETYRDIAERLAVQAETPVASEGRLQAMIERI